MSFFFSLLSVFFGFLPILFVIHQIWVVSFFFCAEFVYSASIHGTSRFVVEVNSNSIVFLWSRKKNIAKTDRKPSK